ncbi:MAG: hypothetical protein ACI8PT_002340 [Gammaproteobacteria bacterium]
MSNYQCVELDVPYSRAIQPTDEPPPIQHSHCQYEDGMEAVSEQYPQGPPCETQNRDEDHRWRAALHLLQYRLHRLGIDCAGFKRDGTFVMAQRRGRPLTIELNMIESGSRTGKLCDWEITNAPGGDLVAFVDLTSEKIWLLTPSEMEQLSTLQADGTRRLYTYADPTLDPEKTGHIVFSAEFDEYLLAARAHRIA